jgi:hypothetical protein
MNWNNLLCVLDNNYTLGTTTGEVAGLLQDSSTMNGTIP